MDEKIRQRQRDALRDPAELLDELHVARARVAELEAGMVAVGTALERLCCAVQRDLNADASESAPCAIPEWADIHDRLATLADECMTALDHPAVEPVMLAALDALPADARSSPAAGQHLRERQPSRSATFPTTPRTDR